MVGTGPAADAPRVFGVKKDIFPPTPKRDFVSCPVCSRSVIRNRINKHLDVDCNLEFDEPVRKGSVDGRSSASNSKEIERNVVDDFASSQGIKRIKLEKQNSDRPLLTSPSVSDSHSYAHGTGKSHLLCQRSIINSVQPESTKDESREETHRSIIVIDDDQRSQGPDFPERLIGRFRALKDQLQATCCHFGWDCESKVLKWRTSLNPFRQCATQCAVRYRALATDEQMSSQPLHVLDDDSNSFVTSSLLPDGFAEPGLSPNFASGSSTCDIDSRSAVPGDAFSSDASGDSMSVVTVSSGIPELSPEECVSDTCEIARHTELGRTPLEGSEFEPYYLKNFAFILDWVSGSSAYSTLFDAEDKRVLNGFRQLSIAAKKLYIRLYQRKRGWFRCDKLHYHNIAVDLSPVLKELADEGYLVNEKNLDDPDEALHLLTAFETRQIASDFQINVRNLKSQTKADIISELRRYGRKQKSIVSFTSKGGSSTMSAICKKAKKILGPCVRLNDTHRLVFCRVLTLFSLTTYNYEDVMYNPGHNQLFQLLQVNTGDLRFPSFSINVEHAIFEERSHLIRYAAAVEMESEYDVFILNKQLAGAYGVYLKAASRLIEIFQSMLVPRTSQSIWPMSLPTFLRCFSEEWIVSRICGKAVELLEKRREYDEAISLIELLLSQTLFGYDYRGVLWERLALDYERYQKEYEKAVDSMETAFGDPFVRTGHRLALYQRYCRLWKAPRCKDITRNRKQGIVERILEPVEVTISAEMVLDTTSASRAVFRAPSSAISGVDDTSFSHVEQYVLAYYRQQGFPFGVHGEGSTLTSLFMLLFWDVVFMDIPDVFHSKYQGSPLDIYRDDFYENRACAIHQRLKCVFEADEQSLQDMISDTWSKNFGVVCVGMNWDLFSDVSEAQSLALCLGNNVVCGICELFCKDFRRRRGGVPDLIVWNPAKRQCKIIEVKGPGDKLSTKQIVWLDVLTFLGADAFVCHVKGIGGKRRRSSS